MLGGEFTSQWTEPMQIDPRQVRSGLLQVVVSRTPLVGRDDHDRAGGMVNATGTDRAQYDGGYPATSARPDHEHVGVQ
jgi:hypothetical protein